MQGQTALLRTCRWIYDEAIEYLYEPQHFVIVLCAGLMRTSKPHHVKHKSLGTAKQCASIFSRMRSITIGIRPGKYPRVPLYLDHVREFAAGLKPNRPYRVLSLDFTFHNKIDHNLALAIVLGCRIIPTELAKGGISAGDVGISLRDCTHNASCVHDLHDAARLLGELFAIRLKTTCVTRGT